MLYKTDGNFLKLAGYLQDVKELNPGHKSIQCQGEGEFDPGIFVHVWQIQHPIITVSVSVYYLATISNTHHEIINTFIKLVEAARRAIRNHKAYIAI